MKQCVQPGANETGTLLKASVSVSGEKPFIKLWSAVGNREWDGAKKIIKLHVPISVLGVQMYIALIRTVSWDECPNRPKAIHDRRMAIMKFRHVCAGTIAALLVGAAQAGLDDYHDADYFDQFNPTPDTFNTVSWQVGYDSDGNDNYNALQWSATLEVEETPLYDNYGNQLTDEDGVGVFSYQWQRNGVDTGRSTRVPGRKSGSTAPSGTASTCARSTSRPGAPTAAGSGWTG